MEALLEGMQRNGQGRYVCDSIIEVLTFLLIQNQILWCQTNFRCLNKGFGVCPLSHTSGQTWVQWPSASAETKSLS